MTIDLTRLANFCQHHDISDLRVFGSVARGDDRAGSDIDLLVRFARPTSLIQLIRIEQELTELLGRPVDLVTEGALSPYMKDAVLRDAQVLYERAA